MKGIVTGTRGFIGSILTQRLLDLGHEVLAIDNFDRGLNRVKLQPNLTLVRKDCREGILDILVQEPYDFIVHLAAGTGSLSRPYEELVDLNVHMTETLYNNACSAGVKLFAFPMTSLSLDSELKDAPYVKSKQDAMDWLLKQNNRTRVVPFMFFNQVGAYKSLTEYRKQEVHVGPTLLSCYLGKVPFVINGSDYDTVDGTPARDYTNVVNTVDFIIHTLGLNLTLPEGFLPYPTPLQLGTGTCTTTMELVQHFREIIGHVDVEMGPRRPFDTAYVKCEQTHLQDFNSNLTLAKDSYMHEWTTLLEIYLPGRKGE